MPDTDTTINPIGKGTVKTLRRWYSHRYGKGRLVKVNDVARLESLGLITNVGGGFGEYRRRRDGKAGGPALTALGRAVLESKA